MKWALYLGKIAGIKIRVHWTFIFIIAWVVFIHARMGQNFQEIMMAVIFVLVIFGCVVLHELGHALTAKRYNIKTGDITLLPIGGVARMERMPEKPKQEFLVAIAGPAVNVAIAAVIYGLLLLFNGLPQSPEDVEMGKITRDNFLLYLMSVNLFIVIFNLIPAFPMDGGRMLRALLSFKIDRIKATQIAAAFGQFFAIIFGIAGLFINPFLILIAIFVYLGATFEAQQTQARYILSNYKVKDAMMKHLPVMEETDNLEKATEKLLEGQEKEFVVMKNGNISGILTRDDIIKGLSTKDKSAALAEVMQKEFQVLNPDTPVVDAFQQMQEKKQSFLPVASNGKLEGVLDMENIMELVMIDSASEQYRASRNASS